jgi:hypothetical protein
MKKSAAILFILTLVLIYACKKEVVNSQDITKNKFIGKWPLKMRVSITIKNNDTIDNDTLIVTPVDTLTFTPEGKYTRGNTTVDYTIDEQGENITYGTTPPTTWNIKFLRIKSIILSQTKTETTGPDRYVYYTEEQLVK